MNEELSENEITLLASAIRDLIPMLKEETEVKHVRQSAFDYYDSDSGETFQVHVTVTRDQDDFLEFLQTEIMS